MSQDWTVADIELGMDAALKAARQGFDSQGEVPIGAATVRDGAVTSVRHTEEVGQRRRLVHADFLALQDADIAGLKTQERKATALVLTLEPCLLCVGAATVFGVGHIHFALESPTDGAIEVATAWSAKIGDLDGFSVPTIGSGTRRDESLELLREFASTRSSGGLWRWTVDTLAKIDADLR